MRNMRDSYSQLCAILAKPAGGPESRVEGTCSGILIDTCQGLVLTHASLLYPLHEQFHNQLLHNITTHGSSLNSAKIFNCEVEIEVVFGYEDSDTSNIEEETETVLSSDKIIQPVLLGNGLRQSSRSFTRYNATIKMVFANKHLRQTIQQLLPKDNWQFEVDSNTNNKESSKLDHNMIDTPQSVKQEQIKNEDLYYTLLPCFVLLQLKDYYVKGKKNLISFRDSSSNFAGDNVEICATPFGSLSPDVFLNSISRGIISKVAGPQGVLILTDARCVPGCEGGGLFYVHRGQRILTGIMIATLCWKNSEWVGLSLACAISQLLGNMKQQVNLDLQQNPYIHMADFSSTEQNFVSNLMSNVACVEVGRNWGSGVCIDADRGLYVTCSHVLNGMEHSPVKVSDVESSTCKNCELVYRTQAGRQFDVAIIQNKDGRRNQIHSTGHQLNVGHVQEGDIVYVIGHAIFRNDLDPQPMVTRGIVSKVNRCRGIPIMVQTTCAVHAGASGGGVYNTHGQLVAMVVCNSRDTVSGASYPHVNMCIPMATIAPVIQKYITTEDQTVLQSLDVQHHMVKQIWSIGHAGKSIDSRM